MKNKFIKGPIGMLIKSFIVILIVCGWWIYDVERKNKYIPDWESLKHQYIPVFVQDRMSFGNDMSKTDLEYSKRTEERKNKRIREGFFYKRLTKIDESGDYLALNKEIYGGMINLDKTFNIERFLEAYLFSEDKVNNLDKQEKVDPRYYLQHSDLSWNYVELLKQGHISSPNMAESYNKIMDSAARLYQGYLLVQEDIVRCANAEYAKKENDGEPNTKKVQEYKIILEKHGKLLRNSVKNLAINLSDSTAHRLPNVYLCKEGDTEPELISDEEWQIKRAEVRKRFLEEFFPDN